MAVTTSRFVAGLLTGIVVASVVFAVIASQGRPDQGSSTILKLAHGLDQTHPVHEAMLFMARRVKEKSGGRVEVQVFPNEQLGSEPECIEQLQRGALAMTKTSTSPMESFVPDMAIFSLPYVFRDDAHFWQVLNGPIGRELLLKGEAKGLRGICYYDAGSRSFYTRDTPIHSPADLADLKIRVQQSRTAMEMIRAMGASPLTTAWGELYTALQQGMVDGAENNLPSFHSSRHFEVCRYLSMDEHTRVPDMLVFSKQVWDTLDPQVQRWIQEAADESRAYQRELWQKKSAEALKAVKEAGVEVIYPDKQPFRDAVSGMHEAVRGTSVGDLLRRIEEVQ